jgi:hypothetical protein
MLPKDDSRVIGYALGITVLLKGSECGITK